MNLYLKIVIHGIFWIVYLAFSLALSVIQKGNSWPIISNLTPHYFVNFLWAAVAFYLFYFYFIRYFEKRKFVMYLVYSVVLSIVITFVFLPVHKLIEPHFPILKFDVFGPPVVGTFIIIQCGSLVRGFEDWFTNIQKKAELENRNLKNELELLKSQLNPHFLFNTLNNIDSLIRSSPENASNSLITLSDMMRYMIYETKSDLVPLRNEILYIKNYLSLQQLRFRNPDYFKASFPENCGGKLIVPILFIPFIENAFKYASEIGIYPVINISINCTSTSLVFECWNYFDENSNTNGNKGGVGLNNVKRRLELLYKNKYSIDISRDNSIFKVVLKINTA